MTKTLRNVTVMNKQNGGEKELGHVIRGCWYQCTVNASPETRAASCMIVTFLWRRQNTDDNHNYEVDTSTRLVHLLLSPTQYTVSLQSSQGESSCSTPGVFNPRPAGRLRPSGRVLCGPGRVFHKIQCDMNIEAWISRPRVRKSRYWGETLQSPIHRCEVSLLVQWRTLNACLCISCAVGAAVSTSLLSEHVNQTS